VKSAIESARKQIASLLNVSPLEIFFTSGGTEADNTFIKGILDIRNIPHVITSPTEHHAVLHTLEHLEDQGKIKLHLLEVDASGQFSLDQLRSVLSRHPGSLVSLMHGNNEIGNLIDLQKVGEVCLEYEAIFHSDCVQTVGHFPIDLNSLPVHSIAASGHKFHGPKGVGFMYADKNLSLPSFIHGGGQERNMRGGTENVYGIVGIAMALQIANEEMNEQRAHIEGLKNYMIASLKQAFPDIGFNGLSSELNQSLYTVLNVKLPESPKNDMLLFHLDLEGVCASAGSACGSGATTGSHVITAIGGDSRRALRFSFSSSNTRKEIDTAVNVLKTFYQD
jgi:cysteine desulfurase